MKLPMSVLLAFLGLACSRGPEIRQLRVDVPAEAIAGPVPVAVAFEVTGGANQVAVTWRSDAQKPCEASFSDASKDMTKLLLGAACAGTSVTVSAQVAAKGVIKTDSNVIKITAAPVAVAHTPPDATAVALAPPSNVILARWGPADVVGIGEFHKRCDVVNGQLVMRILSRDGDFGGCCVGLRPPLNVVGRRAKVTVVLSKPEGAVHLKLERGPMGPNVPQAFIFAGALPAGEQERGDVITHRYVAAGVERFCVAVLGPDPVPNSIEVRGLSFE